jgi:hypothetical protein
MGNGSTDSTGSDITIRYFSTAYTSLPRSSLPHTRRSHAQHDQVPPLALVPDERVVKVVLTAHPEEKVPPVVNTDADSMTRRKVLDQITDLDSQVSAVVPVLQLRKSTWNPKRKSSKLRHFDLLQQVCVRNRREEWRSSAKVQRA